MIEILTADELILKMKSYLSNVDEERIRRAYNLAKNSHAGQLRQSGETYFTHPIEVTKILVDMKLDEESIIAAILHDVVEDTEVNIDEIDEIFGMDVAYLVNGLTKLKKINFKNNENVQSLNIRRMVMTIAEDIRVVIIKLADRLHNMRTLKYMSSEKQFKIANETIEIYTPIAHRLGLFQIKWELEDLALKYIDPDGYRDLVAAINEKRGEREEYVSKVIKTINSSLEDYEIKAEVTGRPKHFYSIYNKLKKKERSIDEIYDLIAIRIIVDTIKDCYSALGIMHMLYKPIPNRFKDYVAMPKPNLYQSIHTTVLGSNGNPFEVQIRTMDMHRIAEYGIAAHWKYKEGKKENLTNVQGKNKFINQINEIQASTDSANDFVDILKTDIFTNRKYVFTPSGDVIELMIDATALDFAYRLHSDVGNTYSLAKANGRAVPIDYNIKNGDIVEIVTNKNSKPSINWLHIVKTKNAQNKIRSYFKRLNRDEALKAGKKLFDFYLKKANIKSTLLNESFINRVAHSYCKGDMDDLFAGISEGMYNTKNFIRMLKDAIQKEENQRSGNKEIENKSNLDNFGQSNEGVRVKGFDNVEVRFSRCCSPLPEDDIAGYINRGKGISIHRDDCPNFLYLKGKEPYRIVEAIWVQKEAKNIVAYIEIVSADRKSITPDIIKKLHELNVDIKEMNTKVKNGTVEMKIHIGLTDIKHLEKVFEKLNKLPEIISVSRKIRKGKKKIEKKL